MDRSESVIVQVAPAGVNLKIKEMEAFGWSLSGQQELSREGNSYGSVSGDTVYTSTEVISFSKLHFKRSLELPNLEKIRGLQAEHDGIGFLAPNRSLKWPLIIAGFGLLGIVANAANNLLNGLLFGGAFVAVGGFWAYKRVSGGSQADETNAEGQRRREELQRNARALLVERVPVMSS